MDEQADNTDRGVTLTSRSGHVLDSYLWNTESRTVVKHQERSAELVFSVVILLFKVQIFRPLRPSPSDMTSVRTFDLNFEKLLQAAVAGKAETVSKL